ncbi:hypothetical protein BDW69DRAFT_163298 [Aspergillus filifer]
MQQARLGATRYTLHSTRYYAGHGQLEAQISRDHKQEKQYAPSIARPSHDLTPQLPPPAHPSLKPRIALLAACTAHLR